MNIGELAALAAALLWASANMLYVRVSMPASSLNLAKNVFATGMMLAHLLWFCHDRGTDVFSASAVNWFWLSLSALIGIAIGDTVFFRSLQILGPRKALMLSILTPVFASFFGVSFLGEEISTWFLIGSALTLTGVLAVIRDRRASDESAGLYPGSVRAGVGFGVLSALCQAAGGACTKTGLQGITPEEGAFIRLLAAAVMALVYVSLRKELRKTVRQIRKPSTIKILLPATIMGTWLGIWLCQVAYANSPLSVAAVLLSTSPLFAIPLVRFFHGHPISRTAIIGSMIAVLGVYLVVRENTESGEPASPNRPATHHEQTENFLADRAPNRYP